MGACPDIIKRLIERFDQQSDQVRAPDYNETQLRIDFVNPMFAELGWDMDNRQGFAEQYREVVHEDRVKVGGQTKAPDYSFRVGGTRKFFLEAKKPHVVIKGPSWEPAYQLRRYGWSAKLAASLLTNFQELAIYDCRIAPKQMEPPATARREYITYQQYPERWDFIEGTFSKRAILQGEFDRYCQTSKGRGAQEFDDAFLEEIEEWRKRLAGNLALRNEKLDERSLNFAVQRIIDRIIFLRICEDRGIEHTGQLRALLNGDKVYSRLFDLFRNADARYNSGLFHFKPEKDRGESPDELTETLDVDDVTLKLILKRLYYPESPYEFTVVSADILGSVYERFLGKVIRRAGNHQAKVEEKPEVRKAGGVYYTPKYIVDYIVQNTVGRLLGKEIPATDDTDATDKGKGNSNSDHLCSSVSICGKNSLTPPQASKLKILDPACGSGSFLLGAYQYLLDWHLQWYVADGPEKWARGKTATLRPGPAGPPDDWRLTIKERKRILLDNIHGVDIDFQAVEVTKLSLLLRVLEGETAESLGGLWNLYRERALPDLGNNILCGNSLIGTDIMATDAWKEMSEDEQRKVNPFDFERAFPSVFKQGGFDAVIGNPPYVRMEGFVPSKKYLAEHYQSHEERADLYSYFLERGLALIKNDGLVGEIVSNKFIKAKYGRPLRTVIADKANVVEIADFAGADVFHGATVRTVVILMAPKGGRQQATRYVPVPPPLVLAGFANAQQDLCDYAQEHWVSLAPDALNPAEWRLTCKENSSLIDRLRGTCDTLSKVLGQRALFGCKTGCNEAFIIGEAERAAIDPEHQFTKPILFGKDIRRYGAEFARRYVIYLHPDKDVNAYSGAREHLLQFRSRLQQRAGGQKWWELQQPAVNLLRFEREPKIIYPIIANECRFALEQKGFLVNDKAFILSTSNRAILGVLNSRLANFYFSEICAALEGQNDRYLEFRAQYVDLFPIPGQIKAEPNRPLSTLVDSILSLQKQSQSANLPQEKDRLAREIAATDRQIDQLVYELYGLSAAEIRLVEEATG